MSDDLIYLEPETHIYFDSEGQIVPGCTSVIGDLVTFQGIPMNAFKHYGMSDVFNSNCAHCVLERARLRGQAGHAATALDDQDMLDESSVHEEVAPRLEGWRSFRADTDFEIEVIDGQAQIEVARMHGHYRYACTKDRSGYMKFGRKRRLILLELKMTAQHSPVTGVQLAAQFEADNRWRKTYGHPLLEGRLSVRLTADGRYNLAPEYTAKDDFAVFVAQLTRHNWRSNHEPTYRKLYHEHARASGLIEVKVEAI